MRILISESRERPIGDVLDPGSIRFVVNVERKTLATSPANSLVGDTVRDMHAKWNLGVVGTANSDVLLFRGLRWKSTVLKVLPMV